MKKISLFVTLGMLLSFIISAQTGLKLTENFNNPPFSASGNLATQNGWAGAVDNPDVQVVYLTNNTGALVYPGYTSGRSYITVARSGSARDPYKIFSGTPLASTTASTYFISFVVNVPSSDFTRETDEANHILALRTSASDVDQQNLAYFYIAEGTSTSQLKFGINKDMDAEGIYAPGNFTFGTTYLIVIRYDVNTPNTSDDRMYLYINPVLSADAPPTSSYPAPNNFVAIVTGFDGGKTQGPDETFSGNINALQLFQDDDGATARFDAFKVSVGSGQGSTANNAEAAWDDLSVAGAPLPVNFANVKALKKTGGIELSFSNLTESDVVSYSMERSANGKQYLSIKELTPSKNDGGSADYSFMDTEALTGYNLYRIKSVERNGKISYSAVVRVDMEANGLGLMIAPNPAKSTELGLQITNLPAGNYKIRIFNNQAQVVGEQLLKHMGGSFSQTLPLRKLQAGMYYLELNGTVKLQKQFIVK